MRLPKDYLTLKIFCYAKTDKSREFMILQHGKGKDIRYIAVEGMDEYHCQITNEKMFVKIDNTLLELKP
jgi:hypothetical protein